MQYVRKHWWDRLNVIYFLESLIWREHLWKNIEMKKFKPFLNQRVRIWGDVVSNSSEERRISVKKIIRIFDGFTKPLLEKFDEFGNLISSAA